MKYLLVLIILLIIPAVYAIDFGNNTFGSGCFGKDCIVSGDQSATSDSAEISVGGGVPIKNKTAEPNTSRKIEESPKTENWGDLWIFIIFILLLTAIREITKNIKHNKG